MKKFNISEVQHILVTKVSAYVLDSQTKAWFMSDVKANTKRISKAANSQCQWEQFVGDGRILLYVHTFDYRSTCKIHHGS